MSEGLKIIEEIPSRVGELNGYWQRCATRLEQRYGPFAPDDELLSDLRLAFTEAVTNAIVHAHGEDGRPLRLELHLGDDEIALYVHDTGPGRPWPPPPIDLLDLDLEAESGRGTMIMQSLMDVDYQKTGSGNVLSLRKNIAPRATQPCCADRWETVDVSAE